MKTPYCTCKRPVLVILLAFAVPGAFAATVSVKDFGARGNGTSDDSGAFEQAINSGASAVYAPCGTYSLNSGIFLANRNGTRLYGAGSCSILKPSSDFANGQNALDLSNGDNLEVDHLAFNMQNVAGRTLFSVVGGTTTSGTHSNISIHDLQISNNSWQGIAVGTGAAAATLKSLAIRNNVISMSHCQPNSCGNAIDIGSDGSRQSVTIQGNTITYPSGSSAGDNPGGVGIFCGHGTTSSFTIANNTVNNAPTDGIQVMARTFNSSVNTSFASNYSVTNNIVNNPVRACIALFGAKGAHLVGNQCNLPLQTGISITFGWSNPNDKSSDFSTTRILLQNNAITSGKDNSAIYNCVYVGGDGTGNHAANAPTGTITSNSCSGNGGSPLGGDQSVDFSGLDDSDWN